MAFLGYPMCANNSGPERFQDLPILFSFSITHINDSDLNREGDSQCVFLSRYLEKGRFHFKIFGALLFTLASHFKGGAPEDPGNFEPPRSKLFIPLKSKQNQLRKIITSHLVHMTAPQDMYPHQRKS